MNPTEFLIDQLHREERGDPWHGPSMQDVLDEVDAARAARRPLAGAHGIWEIVLHVTSWNREVTRRLRDRVARVPEEGDWPPLPSPADDAAWRRSLDGLRASHDGLRAAIEAFPQGLLHTMVGDARQPSLGTGVTYLQMLHGLVQHEAYHAGQMAMLKKSR